MTRFLLILMLASLGAAPASAQAPFEPNDSIVQAVVVEGGRDFVAVHETDNDEDYFQFFLASRTQLDVSVVNTFVEGPECSSGREAWLKLTLPDGTAVGDISPTINKSETLLKTLDFGRYIIQMDPGYACLGPTARYQFRVEPADALVTKDCYDANVAERRAIRNVGLARRAVSRARRSPSLRRRYRRILAQRRAALGRQQDLVERAC